MFSPDSGDRKQTRPGGPLWSGRLVTQQITMCSGHKPFSALKTNSSIMKAALDSVEACGKI